MISFKYFFAEILEKVSAIIEKIYANFTKIGPKLWPVSFLGLKSRVTKGLKGRTPIFT